MACSAKEKRYRGKRTKKVAIMEPEFDENGDQTKASMMYGRIDPAYLTRLIMEHKKVMMPYVEEKKALILDNGLALWDSISSCEITGSSDSSIRNAEPNDLRLITDNCDIRAIYCNGKKSLEIYNKYIEPVLGRTAEALPSTSPANAAWSLERLIEVWSVILKYM